MTYTVSGGALNSAQSINHDFTVKYKSVTVAFIGEILKILSLSEILPVYLVERPYLSVVVVDKKILHFTTAKTDQMISFGCRKLITIFGKFAVVNHGIWQTGPQNLEKFAAENWSLVIVMEYCYTKCCCQDLVASRICS